MKALIALLALIFALLNAYVGYLFITMALAEKTVHKGLVQQSLPLFGQLRRKNFIPSDAFPYTTAGTLAYDSGNYELTLGKALEMIDYPAVRQEQIGAEEGRKIQQRGQRAVHINARGQRYEV